MLESTNLPAVGCAGTWQPVAVRGLLLVTPEPGLPGLLPLASSIGRKVASVIIVLTDGMLMADSFRETREEVSPGMVTSALPRTL